MTHDGTTNGREIDFVWLGNRILAVIGSMDLEGPEALAVISYVHAVLFDIVLKNEAEWPDALAHFTDLTKQALVHKSRQSAERRGEVRQ
jgi:hypothetical protein